MYLVQKMYLGHMIRRRLGALPFLLLCLLCAVGPASAQNPLTIRPVGANPMILECGVQTYREQRAIVSGGILPYGNLVITGSVNTHEPGTYSIHYRISDAAGAVATATRTVITRDTIAPSVSVGVLVPMLWSPNHALREVGFRSSVMDACDESPRVRFQVFSDEDDIEKSEPRGYAPDFAPSNQDNVRLRAERKGNGDGRVYVLVVTATDDSGNVGYDCVTVVVPHNQSKKGLDSIRAQAAAAEGRGEEFARFLTGAGALPAGFFLIGD